MCVLVFGAVLAEPAAAQTTHDDAAANEDSPIEDAPIELETPEDEHIPEHNIEPGDCWIAPDETGLNAQWHSVLTAERYELSFTTDGVTWYLVPDGLQGQDFPAWSDTELEVQVRAINRDGGVSIWTPCGLSVATPTSAFTCAVTSDGFSANVSWSTTLPADAAQVRYQDSDSKTLRSGWIDAATTAWTIEPLFSATEIEVRLRGPGGLAATWYACGRFDPEQPECQVMGGVQQVTVSWSDAPSVGSTQVKYSFGGGGDETSEWGAESPFTFSVDRSAEAWIRVRYLDAQESDWVHCDSATPTVPQPPSCTLEAIVGGATVNWQVGSHTDDYDVRYTIGTARRVIIRSQTGLTYHVSSNTGTPLVWVRANYSNGDRSAWQSCESVPPETEGPTCSVSGNHVFLNGDFYLAQIHMSGGFRDTATTTRDTYKMVGPALEHYTVRVQVRFAPIGRDYGPLVDCGTSTFYDPIAVDLGADGITTTSLDEARGAFDLLGTGTPVASGWITNADGFLAIDTNGNGIVDDIDELFGGADAGDGLRKLAELDSNNDGRVDASDEAWDTLQIWVDRNNNHNGDSGELRGLDDYDIIGFSLETDGAVRADASHNLHTDVISVNREGRESTTAADLLLQFG